MDRVVDKLLKFNNRVSLNPLGTIPKRPYQSYHRRLRFMERTTTTNVIVPKVNLTQTLMDMHLTRPIVLNEKIVT